MDNLLTIPEACRMLGVSRSTIWRYRQKNGLPHYKLGRTLRFSESKLTKWLAAYDPTEGKE